MTLDLGAILGLAFFAAITCILHVSVTLTMLGLDLPRGLLGAIVPPLGFFRAFRAGHKKRVILAIATTAIALFCFVLVKR